MMEKVFIPARFRVLQKYDTLQGVAISKSILNKLRLKPDHIVRHYAGSKRQLIAATATYELASRQAARYGKNYDEVA